MLCWSSREEIPHAQGKRNPSKMVGVARGHQRADTLKPYSQKTSQSNHTRTTALSNSAMNKKIQINHILQKTNSDNSYYIVLTPQFVYPNSTSPWNLLSSQLSNSDPLHQYHIFFLLYFLLLRLKCLEISLIFHFYYIAYSLYLQILLFVPSEYNHVFNQLY